MTKTQKETKEKKTEEKKDVSRETLPKEQAVAVIEPERPAPIVPIDYKTKLTRSQVDIIKSQIAKGATDDELKMFLYVCERTKLDPFTKQVHLVPRWDSKLGKEVRSVIVGVDGLRSVAERTGAYAGNDDPIMGEDTEITVTEKDYKTKKESSYKMMVPSKATVTVKKVVQGVICDFTATAKWSEYYPGDRGGIMWRKMPDNMLGKCAEAKALRKAFPQVMSGLYVAEEMHQASGTDPIEARVDNQSEKALLMIKKVKDAKGLQDFKVKLEGSKNYTAAEKKKLGKAVDERLKELTGKTNETEGTSELHANDAVGGESGEI